LCDRISTLWRRTVASCFIFSDSVPDQSACGRASGSANGRVTHSTSGQRANNGTRTRAVGGALALGRIT